MIKTICAICGKNNSTLLYRENFNLKDINRKTFSARRLPDKIHYRMVKCKNCGLVYANPRLESELIEQLYKKSTYNYQQFEEDLIATYSRYLNKYVTQKNRLLEIGCGNGFFLQYAKNIGFREVWGVEPGRDTVKKAPKDIKKNIITNIFKKGQFKKNYFDVICLFQVFDHIPDPSNLLIECYKILKSGGIVLCINHNVDSFSSKLLKDKSPIIDIEHTYLFNKNTLSEIYRKHEFKILNVFDVINRYPIFYWLRMFPLPNEFKKAVIKYFSKTKIGKTRIWLSPGNIGIVALKK